MRVAITGAGGVVGQALISELDPAQFQVTPLDLPDNDVSDLESLIEATKGHDALIHLAWKGIGEHTWSNTVDPVNNFMTFNVYQAAVANGIPRVIMGSSNQAHRHEMRDPDGRIRYTGQAEIPSNPYGAEKLYMEALGRYFAVAHNLCVVCVRIGNVNPENKPKPDVPTRWLSHNDLGRLITLALKADFEPGHFEIMYGVSRQEVFDWINSFGYEPQDSAE